MTLKPHCNSSFFSLILEVKKKRKGNLLVTHDNESEWRLFWQCFNIHFLHFTLDTYVCMIKENILSYTFRISLLHFLKAHSPVSNWFKHLSIKVERALGYFFSNFIPSFRRSTASFRNVDRRKLGIKEKYSCSRHQSNRPSMNPLGVRRMLLFFR